MRLDDFDYVLPEELIAQAPLPQRDASRLLCVGRTQGSWAHRQFSHFPALLREGDLLVVNDARVIPARLVGRKEGTGGRAELLLVHPLADGSWKCLGQASKGLKPGQRLAFSAEVFAQVQEALGEGEYRVTLELPVGCTLEEALERAGQLPLPPYIQRPPDAADAERYQTVYAQARGSVAAPTAGLHFTPELLAQLEARGVRRVKVTLDVGPGTFLPVRVDDLSQHRMHLERYAVSAETARAVREAKAEGRRVVAVGTTVVRTLEAAAQRGGGEVAEGNDETALFIRPGFRFQVVDALLTNFHLPKSTLLMLVSAFMGRERALAAYEEAVRQRYRFFSYGDAMFIADGP